MPSPEARATDWRRRLALWPAREHGRLAQSLRFEKRERTAPPAVGITLEPNDGGAEFLGGHPAVDDAVDQSVSDGSVLFRSGFMVVCLEFGGQPGELGTKPAAGAMKSGLDGGHGDAQALGDLTCAQSSACFKINSSASRGGNRSSAS